jgi:hypothetical protein
MIKKIIDFKYRLDFISLEHCKCKTYKYKAALLTISSIPQSFAITATAPAVKPLVPN